MSVVKVEQGMLKGAVCIADAENYYAYKGIPYAKPPIGKLRFKAPEPPDSWDGVRDALEHGPVCPQYNERLQRIDMGSEDCLFLNVYTKTLQPEKKLPVMVWIHGGAFYTGSGNSDYYGPEFFMQHNVVLVTFNYRLEVFGFLCLDNEEVPGNAGLKDQVAALTWVKKNICSFGGDPENITIFGCSAGASSTSYHMISEMSQGLFNKAICQSGVCLNDWSYNIYARQRALQLGKLLGKDTKDVNELLQFLRGVPSESLINVKLPTVVAEYPDISDVMTFSPVIENPNLKVEKFISDAPINLVKKGKISKIPIMLGYTSGEGIEICRNFVDSVSFFSKTGMVLPRELKLNTPLGVIKQMDEKVRHHYFGNKTLSLDILQNLVNLHTDSVFSYNIRRFARYHFINSLMPVYFYKFTTETERNHTKKSYKMDQVGGVCHADDLPYLFNIKCLKIPLTENSKLAVEQVVKLWVNFASCGNPTANFSNVEWKPFTEEDKYCFIIDRTLKCDLNVNEDNMRLWDELYGEKLIKIEK
ncbi:juvenile hormone esterase-like isoform X1 [Zerene cesonia]|uniref:juvenile hormone esterase-like isoform X1 n=2 Tax=Zerene cesonia TaxID=33412 RepID=UPI0018E5A5D1|nr:juvenile hormone esterase-like isoform X1 [Zerene cesonia]